MHHSHGRATLGGKLSAVLVAAGSSVGLGNIWRFPYVAGDNGGGAFLVIYILCVLLLGLPIMVAEFSVGRASHRNAVGAYRALAPKWSFLGYNGVVAAFLILGFYFVVSGWTAEYMVHSVTGSLARYTTADEYKSVFENFIQNPWRPVLYTALFVLATHFVIAMGVQKGIERSAKILMPLLLLILIVVSTLGVNVTSLIAVASAATLAIGMALSGTAQNFAGGVMILLMKPYRVGDFISAQGQSGTVREIKLFSTVITTGDNQTIYIPNNSIATAIIDNYSTSETRRVDWTVGISYGDDVDVARKAVLSMLAADPRVLSDPAPVVWVAALADSSVNLSIRAWVKNADYWNVFFEHNEQFYKELPKAGINFPFPQMDVHLTKE